MHRHVGWGKPAVFLTCYVTLVVLVVVLWGSGCSPSGGAGNVPIKVGILHSLTGTMATSERAVVEATQLAIEQLNEKGGVLGRRIEPVVADGRSDPEVFAQEGERLISQEKVTVLFGCWTSASRKTLLPVLQRHDQLLFYPVQYEGLESSSNIVYLGAAPNQQVIPGVRWCLKNLGKRLFLVGSDYVFPRTAHEIIKLQAQALRGTIVGEAYLPLGASQVQEVIQQILAAKPDVILNTINGSSNEAFFSALRQAGVTPDEIPTVSFSLGEQELVRLGPETMAGDYAVWNYFQSVDTEENRRFVAAFRKRYGAARVTADPMEAAYCAVHFWAQAVELAKSTDIPAVRESLPLTSYRAPQGVIYLAPHSQHTWKYVRVGRIQPNGQFEIVWSSDKAVRPVPYPIYRPEQEWDQFLQELYKGWGKRWYRSGD